jgi:DNA invertase Pin-like site-specific DNA recombinase
MHYCILYARVSTDKQADKELSIPAQLQAMRQHAEQRGWAILGEFVEAGVSGRKADRPALRQLLHRCRDHAQPHVEVVLVHKLDRLARNLADHVAIRAQLRDVAVTLASVTESVEDSVSGQLVEHILASMAEFYSANLSEEVKKGMRQKVLQGGWPHRPPRGYRIVRANDRSAIVIDDVDGPLVRKAFEICLAGYRGLVDLRIRLALAGLRTRKTDQPLSNGRLGALLRNPFYCGMLRWNEEMYPASHPPLISPAMFEQVQRVLANRSKSLRRGSNRFLLTGLASCAGCGRLVGGDGAGKWQYYRCRGSFKAFERCKAKYCRLQTVHADLEHILRDITPSAAARAELRRRLTAMSLKAIQARDLERSGLRMQLAGLHQRERHLTRAFTQGVLRQMTYDEALANVDAERKQITGRLKALPIGNANRNTVLRSSLATARTAWDLHELLSFDEQRLLVQVLFDRLELNETGIVRYVLKGYPQSVDNLAA